MSDAPRTAPPAPPARADVRRTWFPGWIWAVPLAAVAVVGWLLVHAFTRGGTDITIAFADVHGLTAEDAAVVYRGTPSALRWTAPAPRRAPAR
jgi:paraquat-inducible protein B